MAEQAHQADTAPKSGKKVPLLLIIGVIVLLNLVVVGKIFLFPGGKHSGKQAKKVAEVGTKLQLDEFLVNLDGGSDHYLKTQLALGLRKDVTEDKMKEEVAPARDAILSVLTSKSLEDISTERGRDKLKQELVDRINKELGDDKVVKVYFVSFATQ